MKPVRVAIPEDAELVVPNPTEILFVFSMIWLKNLCDWSVCAVNDGNELDATYATSPWV